MYYVIISNTQEVILFESIQEAEEYAKDLAADAVVAVDINSPEIQLIEEIEYDDSMDGDHESALASVGWGTDEDYNPGETL